ncbi:MAG: hypothetical protein ABL309_13915 [Phycisphaerales bacterium]
MNTRDYLAFQTIMALNGLDVFWTVKRTTAKTDPVYQVEIRACVLPTDVHRTVFRASSKEFGKAVLACCEKYEIAIAAAGSHLHLTRGDGTEA